MFRSFMSPTALRVSTRSADGRRAGLTQVTVAGLLWGTTGIVVQALHRSTDLSPAGIGFYRLAVAAAVLFLLIVRRRGVLWSAVRRAPLPLVLIGCGLGAYQALYFYAVAMGGVAVATVVSLGLAPVLIAGWEALRARRLPSRIRRCSLLLAIVGLALIAGLGVSRTAATPHPSVGLLAAAGSGLGYAATTVLSRHVSDRVQPATMTAVSTVIGAFVLAPIAVLGGGVGFVVQPVSAAMLAYLGVVTTAVAYALFYAGLRTTTGSVAAILTLLEPLTAALLAILILHEPLSPAVLAGSVLLLSAVLFATISPDGTPK